MRRSAIAPFSFCHRLVNDLRQVIKDIQCHTEASNVGPLLIIFLALLALGIGRTMPWTLGVPLIDDNVKSKNMPVYFGNQNFVLKQNILSNDVIYSNFGSNLWIFNWFCG